MKGKILSISEAAEYVGVFPLTLRNWEKKGLINSFRTPGGHRRFKKSELNRIIDSVGEEDELMESIRKLERIEFENGRQRKLNKAITDLKDISDEL